MENLLDGEPGGDSAREMARLLKQLEDEDGLARKEARVALERYGSAAVPYFMKALRHLSRDVRWEAAKALEEVPDPAATHALVKTLTDKDFDVRWLAAEALIKIGAPALSPLLLELAMNARSFVLRQGAHHVLSHYVAADAGAEHHNMKHPLAYLLAIKDIIMPVVNAAENEPSVAAATAAWQAYEKLRNMGWQGEAKSYPPPARPTRTVVAK